jgi:hypothetical protein
MPIILHTLESVFYILLIVVFIGMAVLIRRGRKTRQLVYALIVLVLLFVILQRGNTLVILNDFYLSGPLLGSVYRGTEFDLDFQDKYRLLIEGNTQFIIGLFLLGSALAVSAKEYEKIRGMFPAYIVALVFFLPDPFTYRIAPLMTPFLSVAAGYAVGFGRGLVRRFGDIRLSSVVYTGLILIVLMYKLVTPLINFVNLGTKPSNGNYFGNFRDYEYEVAMWVKRNTERNTLIVSDPWTTWFVVGLSNRQLFLEAPMLEQELTEQGKEVVRRLKEEVFRAENPYHASRALQLIIEQTPVQYQTPRTSSNISSVILIVSGRTSKWLELDHGYFRIFWDQIDSELLKIFTNPSYFRLLYRVDDKIFVVSPRGSLSIRDSSG